MSKRILPVVPILFFSLIVSLPAVALAQGPGLSVQAATATPTAGPSNPDLTGSMLVGGDVWSNGLPAFTTIRAFVGSTECGTAQSIQVLDGDTTSYTMSVLGAARRTGCAQEGSVVTFTVGDVKVDKTVVWKEKTTARANLVAGGPFDRIGGRFAYPGRVPADLAVEALINGVQCGQQLNGFQGEGPEYDFDVVVFSDQIRAGCGRPGAEITLQLAGTGPNTIGKTTLAVAVEKIPWQIWDPEQQNPNQVNIQFNFLSMPNTPSGPTSAGNPLTVPNTGSGPASAHHGPSPLNAAIPLVGLGLLLAGVGLSLWIHTSQHEPRGKVAR